MREIVDGLGGTLPMTLTPRADGKPTAAIYQTASSVRPSIRLEVKTRHPASGLMEFSLTADRSIILAPTRCAGARPTTQIDTGFSRQLVGEVVNVDATLPWQCLNRELRTP